MFKGGYIWPIILSIGSIYIIFWTKIITWTESSRIRHKFGIIATNHFDLGR